MEITVKRGDNLSTLAKKNGVTVRQIMQANPNIKNANVIRVGQKINIPTVEETQPQSGQTTAGKPKTDKLYVSKGEVPEDYEYANLNRQDVAREDASSAYYHNGVPVMSGDLASHFGSDIPVTYVEDDTGSYLTAGAVGPEIEVVAQAPKTKLLPKTEVPKWYAPIQDLYNTLVSNRVAIHQNPDNKEVLQAVKEGGDFVGNAAIATMTAPLVLGNAATLYGMAQAGQWLPIATTIGGAAAGYEATDALTEAATGKTLTQHMLDQGLWGYNTAILHPGANIGGWIGGKAGQLISNNAAPWITNQTNHVVPGEMRPLQSTDVVVQPGETVRINNVSNTQTGYSTNMGRHHGSRGVASGNSNHKVTSGGGKSGKITSYGNTPYSTTHTMKNVVPESYRVAWEPYNFEAPYDVTFPWFSYEAPYIEPTQPPVQPPVYPIPEPEPEPEERAVQIEPISTEWQKWFERQRKINPGTDQYYEGTPGDPRSGKWYRIELGTGGSGQFVKRSVGKQTSGSKWPIATDSTSVYYQPGVVKKSVSIVPGRVDPAATISDTEFIDISNVR